ncbi:two-component system, NtrC family, C4-dicarboxylate transport sensor histidine kinase DctB [Roseovarius nanhaiticus]|uniref:C4-dicarboxylate transport sensor protein DctB n=2 Tax=Roseovarius nanhaiticus TaxID=573024 RepID=A0A1N7HLB3_9RHOB|nr:two-component system, NtrC family, C4-dicarboxylate transport sensor histidine kinase DctB [Roseovarius nanhaiticus]SIS25664.1 two-component system, NtrC family, C4-dicarboxylate transport sensor histidine kinase DctB [Roseovarius nanhaiticus]
MFARMSQISAGWRLALQLGLAALILATLVWPRVERYFLRDAAQQNRVTLQLVSDGLRAALDRYAPLPNLIAAKPELARLLQDPDDARLTERVNDLLLNTAISVTASDVYLMDMDGLTLAASSYRKERSFVGRNFSFRPYFTQAAAGGLGRYFALGITSGERGYFFAAPVRDGPRILGVVAVKFTVEPFEAGWQAASSNILVTDNAGIVFMASRPDWRLRATVPLTPRALSVIRANQQYPADRLALLDIGRRDEAGVDMAVINGTEYIASSGDALASAGWTVTALRRAAPARLQAGMLFAAIALLVILAICVASYLRHRAAQRVQVHKMLEQRVEQRTSALRHEIEERRRTEEKLRRTQAGLVQAGKLSALGQMSAALSHEFNQPLQAVKAYAENAQTFLDRGETGEVRDNIGRISRMADRMAAISRHLRNFARRPGEAIGPVPLNIVIDDALAVSAPKLKSSDVVLDYTPAADAPWVIGGHVRLQQVAVNLISNAVDAVGGRGRIELRAARHGEGWRVTVRDNGPGLPENASEQMFDPFFTTKPMGQGLGLGLSISYNIVRDFGGTLWGETHPDGGAIFGIDLIAAEVPMTEAAE